MSYNTVAEMRLHAFPSGSLDLNSDAQVQAQLDAAASEIDSALLVKHTLPLASTPAVIAEAERTIASFRLLLFNGARPNSIDEFLRTRYYEVVGDPGVPGTGLLYRIATGKMSFATTVDATTFREATPTVVAGSTRTPTGNFGVG